MGLVAIEGTFSGAVVPGRILIRTGGLVLPRSGFAGMGRDQRCINQRAALQQQPARFQLPVDLGQDPTAQALFAQKLAEARQGRVIRHLITQRQAHKAPERQAVSQGFFEAGIRQLIPLLQQQAAQ